VKPLPVEPTTESTSPAKPADEQQRSSRVTLRRGAFVTVSGVGLALAMWSTDSSDVASLIPYFFVASLLQFLPLFWPTHPDPFAPPALAALMFGPELLGETFSALASGTLRYPYLEELPASVRLELLQKALTLWILGSACYLVGYYLGVGKKRVAALLPNVNGLTWYRGRIQLASAVCIGIFVLTYAFFQNRIQADITDVTALAAGKAVWRDDPSLTWLGRGILLGFIPLLFWIAAAARAPSLRRWIIVAIPSIAVALLASRLGQRSYALMFGFSALIVIHNVHKPFRLSILAALAIVAMLANQIQGEWRGRDIDPYAQRPTMAARMAPDRVLSSYASDRNRLPVIATVMFYIPDRQDYLLGQSFVALLAAPIPKWIWPGKVDYFKWRDSALVGNLHGIPAPTPLQGVLYANFSWLGAAIGMFFWGAFQRGLYEWLLINRKDVNQAMLYAAFALYFAPSSLAIASALQYIVPTWLIIMFVARRRGSKPITSPAPVTAPEAA
jgi:hypothetical protein